MAPQKRIIRKAVPGYTLVPEKGCYKARKIGLSGDRVKKDPAFAMTRRYAAEFGYAAKAGKLIRAALKQQKPPGGCTGRLTSLLLKAMNTDKEGTFGERNLLHADLSSLVGFEFNLQHTFANGCLGRVEVAYGPGRHTEVRLPALIPAVHLQYKGNATHVRIGFQLIALDPAKEKLTTAAAGTGWLPYNATAVGSRSFVMDTGEGEPGICLVCSYIEWGIMVNGRIGNRAPCPLAIIAAWNRRTTQNNPGGG